MATSKLGRTEVQLWEPWSSDQIPNELFTICLPTDFSASKNKMFHRGNRRLGYTKEAKKFKDDVTLLCRAAMRDCREVEPKRKVWLSIHVEMSKHLGDAANFVEIIQDGVRDAIGVDDRYFSLWRLDWSIAKFQPNIYIGVAQ